ncbi:hypothetical protein NUW54_g6045 [Trametes sanguinea]|uniref:Uncharacterized protein n=1 Tax=Trametes sanguinea TaxID=158606 RepID=A0ACC1PWQ9_9APHY|nr:hypothetical protein NUW54_g6045 [Trametes sanguinea]
MALDMQQLRETALDVLKNVVKEGKVHEFTYGKYRRKVEEVMSLEADTLATPEYKSVVKAIAEDFMNNLEQEDEEHSEQEVSLMKEKAPSSAPRKQAKESRAASSEKNSKGRSATKGSTKGKKAARSASVVPSSEDEAGSGTEPSGTKPKSRTKATSKQKRVEGDSEESTADVPAKRPKKGPNTKGEANRSSAASPSRSTHVDPPSDAQGDSKNDPRSDSEMSVLIDEPPPRKQRRKKESEDTHNAKTTKSKKSKGSAKELSKDEETIKKLKSLVVACGVRKVWSKEFSGLDRPSDQIRRLKQILSDLGMTGRMSMEQAKAIKAKREFEKELQDVQEFASRVTSGPSTRAGKQQGQGTDEEHSLSDVEAAPKRRTARQSIMAFLGDETMIDLMESNLSLYYTAHMHTSRDVVSLPQPSQCSKIKHGFTDDFISSSPHASVVEQFQDIKKIIEATHREPVRVLYASTRKMIRFRIFVHAEPSDNPMQSELTGHIGGRGNLFCRKCEAGGSDCEKATNDGYHALFKPGVARTKEKVLDEVKTQLAMACLGVEKHVKARQTLTGVKDMYAQSWIEDLIHRARQKKQEGQSGNDVQHELLQWVNTNQDAILNPCLTLTGLDPTIDTPIEILHTILLGVVKYAWYDSHTSWDDKQKATYARRLQSTSTDGLSIHAIRAQYIMQYANSLIGRQLKTVVQTTAFHARSDLCSPLQRQLWIAVGNLTALLWFPEIADLETYLGDVDVEAGNVLDLFAEMDPSKMLEKIKLHLLAHLREDIRRFGPLVGVCSESFECFNAVTLLYSLPT